MLDKEAIDAYEGGGSTLKGNWSIKDLQAISDLDNQHSDKGPRASSGIIMKDFGGIDGLLKGLESNMDTGVSEKTVAKRKSLYGTNAFPPP